MTSFDELRLRVPEIDFDLIDGRADGNSGRDEVLQSVLGCEVEGEGYRGEMLTF